MPEFDFDCRDTRHLFSIANCNGCHSREADVGNFRHVNGRATGTPSTLSEFLTGVPRAARLIQRARSHRFRAITRQFNDIHRRALDLCGTSTMTCLMETRR